MHLQHTWIQLVCRARYLSRSSSWRTLCLNPTTKETARPSVASEVTLPFHLINRHPEAVATKKTCHAVIPITAWHDRERQYRNIRTQKIFTSTLRSAKLSYSSLIEVSKRTRRCFPQPISETTREKRTYTSRWDRATVQSSSTLMGLVSSAVWPRTIEG
jgi:hypothetical protein